MIGWWGSIHTYDLGCVHRGAEALEEEELEVKVGGWTGSCWVEIGQRRGGDLERPVHGVGMDIMRRGGDLEREEREGVDILRRWAAGDVVGWGRGGVSCWGGVVG